MRVEWVIGDNFLRAAKGVWSVHLTFQLLPAATSRQSHLTLLSYLRKSASISPRRISGLRLVFVSRPFGVLFRKSPTGCARTRERSRSQTICCGRDNSRFSLPHHADTRPLLLRSSLGSHNHAITLVEPFAGPEYLSAVGFSPGT